MVIKIQDLKEVTNLKELNNDEVKLTRGGNPILVAFGWFNVGRFLYEVTH